MFGFQNYGYKLINLKHVVFITVSDEVLFIIIIYLLQLSFQLVAVVLTLVTSKNKYT